MTPHLNDEAFLFDAYLWVQNLLMRVAFCISSILFVFFFIVFSGSAIATWFSGFGWHDQQRICQLLLIICGMPLLIFLPQKAVPLAALAIMSGIFVLGLISSWLSDFPYWALKEWARYVGLSLLMLLVAGQAHKPWVRSCALWAVALVGCVHAVQFLVFYSAAFISSVYILNADLLFGGFANPRFFGQFQVMLLPVLAMLLAQCWQRRMSKVAVLLMLIMVVQWCVAFLLGGRGLWLGVLVSHILIVLVNRSFWRFLVLQVSAAVLGFLVYLLLFKLVPYWLELEPILRDGLRATLSGRELIWRWAWDMAVLSPWLGVGPMHFSATYNPIAAHPHQVILQWLSEWGGAATALALVLAVWGGARSVLFLQCREATPLDAGLWGAIVGALVLAQVDGVFVMPYSETWLVILVGLALARWGRGAQAQLSQRMFCLILAMPVVVILGLVLVKEAPTLPQSEEAYMKQHAIGWKPRFWQQGWIPMDIERSASD